MAYRNGIAGESTINSGTVRFRLCSQSELDTIANSQSAINGAFYLTNDTYRLYIGNKDNDICPVNPGIIPNNTQTNSNVDINTEVDIDFDFDFDFDIDPEIYF